MKKVLVAAFGAFVAIELGLVGWLVTARSLDQSVALLGEPAVLAMLVDFTFVTFIAFGWIVQDARSSKRNPWPWLPLLLAVPTIGLLGYLLTRRGEQPSDDCP